MNADTDVRAAARRASDLARRQANSGLEWLVAHIASQIETGRRRVAALELAGLMIGSYIVLAVIIGAAFVPVEFFVGDLSAIVSWLVLFGALGSTGWVGWAAWQQADREERTRTNQNRSQTNQGPGQNQHQQNSSERKFVKQPPDMDFGDVAGMEPLKRDLDERVIDPLRNPEFYEEYGLGVENGILFYGPPGTGKTHMAKALAGELGVNHIEAKAGDLVSKWIGEGAQNVQQMFDEARANQPCLIFIDEIDALATDRGTHQSKSERQMVNQFLEELTQLNDDNDNVIVIGATNRIDDLDSAMLRTGRFTEKIEVPPPDAEARVQIFQHHLSAPCERLRWDRIAEQTEGFVASDMESVAERVARKAMQRARASTGPGSENGKVTQDGVTEAVAEVQQGRAAAD
jgi:SpoVK/Ycf46/Vps4 family AAA+-type ATPase